MTIETTGSSGQASTDTAAAQTQTAPDTTLLGGGENSNQSDSDTTLLGQGEPADKQTDDKTSTEKTSESAPESYQDFSFPEGVQANEELVGEFKTIAKEFNLTQEKAQKLIDLQTKYHQKQSETLLSDYRNTVNQWAEESKKEFGSNLGSELKLAAKARDKFGTPEMTKLLNDTGLGNHKLFVKFFANIGKQVSEDSLADGRGGAARKSDGELFYPDMK